MKGTQRQLGAAVLTAHKDGLRLRERRLYARAGAGCETGPVVPHPTNPDTVYGACKGQLTRLSLRTGQEKQYWVGAQSLYGQPTKDLVFRFQRVAPIEVSPHDARVIYHGSQHVHRSTNGGWWPSKQ